jgi:hypothetical protein
MTPQVDFTLLFDKTEGYAVHCSNYTDAETLVQQARIIAPNLCNQWGPGEINYRQHESETIYTFDAKQSGKWTKLKLMYGSVGAARDMGYTIIEFSEICQEEDINESEASLDVLFG